jgi:hypothetical protein
MSGAKSTGSLSRLPGVSGLMATGNEVVAKTGSEAAPASLQPATSTPEVSELVARLPAAPTKLGVTTESIKKTTFTETVVKRVTNNQAKPKIEARIRHFLERNILELNSLCRHF